MQKNDDKISVIIPIYNRKEYINECVDSVFSQTHQNFEIIITDDGSTDGSIEVCHALAERDPRVKFYAFEHGGVSESRNRALQYATGDYVFFLDSDDIIHPMLFETLVSGMKANNASIGATCVLTVNESIWHKLQEKLKGPLSPCETVYNTPEETLDSMFSSPLPALSCIGGVMMSRRLIGDTRFNTELFIGEDYLFIYENVIKNASSVFLKQKWYFVRIHGQNISRDHSFNGFITRFRRRELVWKSEEKAGRIQNSNLQKTDAFDCFLRCFKQTKPYSEDGKKMRGTLKEYKKDILPALPFKKRILYRMYIYIPSVTKLIFKLKNKH